MTVIFKGWVPTVAGNLSFSAFGEASHKPRTIWANRTDSTSRYLICYRGKDASDIILPFRSWLAPLFLSISGKMWFLCVAKMDSHQGEPRAKLEGKLLLFHNRPMWKGAVEDRIRDIQTKLRQYKYDRAGITLEQYFEHEFTTLIGDLPELSSFNVNFSVLRTGEATITIDESAVVSQSAPKIVGSEQVKAHMIHVVSAQLFFFLRDIGHRHQHHDANTDTIVDLHRQSSENDNSWRYYTLYSLYRKIIQYKRHKHSSEFQSALGVLAYANTFRDLCNRNMTEEEQKKMPYFNDESTSRSIQAVEYMLTRENNKMSDARIRIINILLPIIAIIISFTGVLQLTSFKIAERPAAIIEILANYIITSPIQVISIVLLSLVLNHWLTSNYGPSKWKFCRDFVRACHWFKSEFLAAAFLILGFAVVFGMWYLINLLRS